MALLYGLYRDEGGCFLLDTYMVSWSGSVIPSAEMMVMRRVAVEMRTIHGVKEVEFMHDICAGLCRFEKAGIMGAVGGLYFFGDFGAKHNQPNTVDFFIPRFALHMRGNPGIVIQNSAVLKADGTIEHSDYPEDVDPVVARGAGKLKITVRKEI